MGIIQRQSIKFTIVSLIGTLIGALSTIYIYPLSDANYGYANWLVNTSYLLMPLFTLGLSSAVIKFYPKFKNEDGDGGFFSFVIGLYVIAFTLFVVSYLIIRPWLFECLSKINFNVQKIRDAEYHLMLIAFLVGVIKILIRSCANAKRIAIPQLIDSVGYKFFLPIILFYAFVFNQATHFLLNTIPIFFLIIAVVLFVYAHRLGVARFRRIQYPKNLRFGEIVNFSLFGALGEIGNMITTRLDMMLIPLIISDAANGIYGKLVFLVGVLNVPLLSIMSITSPMIAEYWHTNAPTKIEQLYKQSSRNLLFIGGLMFLFIHLGLPSIIQLSGKPESFEGYYWITIILGISQIANLTTSINGVIIVYSKYFRWATLFIVILAATNLVLDTWLIREYGILGAAIATASALLLFNMMKVVFVYIKFGMHPFTYRMIYNIALVVTMFMIGNYLPISFHPIVNLIIITSTMGVLYLGVGYYLNIAPDVNRFIEKYALLVRKTILNK